MSDSYTVKAGRVIQLLGFISLAILVVAGVFVIVNRLLTAQPVPAATVAAFAAGILLAIAYFIVGMELTKYKKVGEGARLGDRRDRALQLSDRHRHRRFRALLPVQSAA